jgi:hypothetical protein
MSVEQEALLHSLAEAVESLLIGQQAGRANAAENLIGPKAGRAKAAENRIDHLAGRAKAKENKIGQQDDRAKAKENLIGQQAGRAGNHGQGSTRIWGNYIDLFRTV